MKKMAPSISKEQKMREQKKFFWKYWERFRHHDVRLRQVYLLGVTLSNRIIRIGRKWFYLCLASLLYLEFYILPDDNFFIIILKNKKNISETFLPEIFILRIL